MNLIEFLVPLFVGFFFGRLSTRPADKPIFEKPKFLKKREGGVVSPGKVANQKEFLKDIPGENEIL